MDPADGNQLYEFGEFRLDVKACALRRGEETLTLSPKVFEVLRLLVERRGAVVSKKEMMETIWADSFVEDANMTQSIYTLRRVLGKSADGASFIENVPRRGYRFAVPVRVASSEQNGEGKVPELEKKFDFSADEEPPAPLTEPTAETTSGQPRQAFAFSASTMLIAFGLTALVVFGGAAFYFYPFKTASNASLENIVFQKLTFTGDISVPVISPDGKSFAFVRDENLYLQDIKTGNNFRLNLAGHRNFGHLQFSPDGEQIYFRDRSRVDLAGDVLRVSRFGGEALVAAENVWSGFGVSPDGRRIAFVRFFPEQAESAIMVKDLQTGEEEKLLARRLPEDLYRGKPAWSPDGKKLAVVTQTPETTQISKLFVLDAESGAAEEINTPRLFQMEQPAWTAEGDALLMVARENRRFMQLWRISYPDGEVRKLTNDLNIYRGLSLSADGKNLLAYQYTFYSHLWTATADNLENARQITFGNLNRDGNAGLAWTPDGNLIYCSRIMGDRDLWQIRPADGSRRQLTENAGDYNEEPFVAADGKYVFYESTRSGTQHIWRMDANGENPTQVTFSENEIETYPAASPDGKWLYYIRKGSKASAVIRQSLSDGKTEALTASGQVSPAGFLALSPDGKFLAFHNLTEKNKRETNGQILQIGIISAERKAAPQFLQIKASSPVVQWAPDGRAFDFVENSAGEARLWRQSLDGALPPKMILNIPNAEIYNFVWSAGGKHLAIARGQQSNDAVLLTNFAP